MTKSADAFRTISEVADDLGIPKHVLRFWEVKFAQIRPMKRGGGRRYYRPEDLELLKGIRHLLHREGYTIKGVQKILREQGVEAVKRRIALRGAEAAEPAAGTASGQVSAVSRADAAAMPKAPIETSPATAVLPASRQADMSPATQVGAGSSRSVVLQRVISELEACRAILREQPVTHQTAPGEVAVPPARARRSK